jgi:tetratricopeptide (TPR) repeat protein
MEGTARESSKLYQIGNIQANQLFLGNESAASLLERIQQSGKAESVGILKTRDLPKSLDYWQGRVEEIEKLRQWLADENIRLIGIEGIGGTGKSMLATKIYEEIEGFPKRFWADVSSGATIFSDLARRVLTDFGCRVPEEELQLVTALVQCLRLGQYLLVIDNLESLLQSDGKWTSQFYEEFFRTWIEYGGGSKILVTTREKPELKGFEWLPLKGLKKEEGADLLRELGIQGEVEAFAELVDGHPLLLKIVADLIKDEYPQDPSLERLAELGLGNLRELLTDPRVVGQHRRENVGIVLVLDASFERLTDWQKIWLQNVSVYRGAFDGEAAVAVFPQPDESCPLPVERGELEQELRKLVKRSLLEEKLNGKRQFAFQPVVLEYVRYKAGEQTEAHQQAIAYYRSIAKEKPWQTIDNVKEYLEIFYHYYQLGDYDSAFDSVWTCNNFLTLRGYYAVRVEVYGQLVAAWQQTDARENWNYRASLISLGNAYYSLGQYQEAIAFHQQSLAIFREIGARGGEASSYNNLGSAYNSLGQYQEAIAFYQQSLAICREIGARGGEASSYGNLGNAYDSLGQYQEAIAFYQQSLAIKREIGDRGGEARSYNNLGNAYNSLGQYQEAIAFYQQSLAICREIGARGGEASAWFNLGLALENVKRESDAVGAYRNARELYQVMGLDSKTQMCDREIERLSQPQVPIWRWLKRLWQ